MVAEETPDPLHPLTQPQEYAPFLFFLAVAPIIWCLSSLTKDRTWAPCIGNTAF